MSAREPGFYWVQLSDEKQPAYAPTHHVPWKWTVAEWDESFWQVIGWEEGDGPRRDRDLLAIDERRIDRSTIEQLRAKVLELAETLRGVIYEADRETDELERARVILANVDAG